MKKRNISFGYQFENGKIIRHPAESRIVSNIFEDYLQGGSLLQIAKKLNGCGAEYMPGVTGWNKARLKRIVEDVRYLGDETYPPIIDTDTFGKAQKIKAERNTQKDIDRSADIYSLNIPVCCEQCGQLMRRMHDSRTSFGEKWICQGCGAIIKIGDEKLLTAVTECLNMAIADTRLIDIPVKQKEPSAGLRRLENEIGRMLDSTEIEKDTLKNKIFECASLRYSEMDITESVTEMLKAAFKKSGPLSQYSQEFTERTVTAILLNGDESVCLTLKNGRKIGKENANGTDCNNASKESPRNPADNTADQRIQHTVYHQASGGLLPRVNQAG